MKSWQHPEWSLSGRWCPWNPSLHRSWLFDHQKSMSSCWWGRRRGCGSSPAPPPQSLYDMLPLPQHEWNCSSGTRAAKNSWVWWWWVTHSQPTNNIQHPADTHTTATAPLDDDAGILDTEVGSPVLCLVLYTKLSPNLQDVLQGKWVNMWWLFIRHTSSSAHYQPNVYTDFLVTVSAQRHSKHINDVGFISFILQYWIEF